MERARFWSVVLPVLGLALTLLPAGPATADPTASTPDTPATPANVAPGVVPGTASTSVGAEVRPGPSGARDGDQEVDPYGDLGDDAVLPEWAGVSARVRPWPGHRIRYYESIPKKWDWSLNRAIDHWNDSGGKMRFVEVPRRRAQLVIGYGDTGGAAGVGTLGYQYRNYVHLSPSYKRANEFQPETRVWVGRLFTHELGHVLGFNHTSGQCALMYPIYDFGLCPPLPNDQPGYYNCRWIDKSLLRRFTQIYGGSPKRPAKLCLIEALPGQLAQVEFGGGQAQSTPVRITWRPPSKIRARTRTLVTVWKGSSCAGALPDTWDRRVVVDTRAGSWTDPSYGQGTWCYRLQIENRYGATRPPHSAARSRYAPVPAAPEIGPLTWNANDTGYRFTWAAPRGTRLYVMRGEPGACPTTFDEFEAEFVDTVSGEQRRVYATAPAECLSFFAVTDWDTVSPPTPVEVAAPTPTAPEIGPLAWRSGDRAYRFTWQQPGPSTSLSVMRNFDDPTSCVTTYDEAAADYVSDVGGGSWQVWGNAARECLTFFAVTAWGTVSPGRSVNAAVPAPGVTPNVGPVTVDQANPSAATATVTLPDDTYRIGIEVLPGPCPAQPPAGSGWWDGWDAGGDRWVFYPESPDPGGTNCALFTALDDSFSDLHGPVVMRSFSVPAP